METINTKVRKWGNSFGVVIPISVIQDKGIKENSDVSIIIEPNNRMTVGDLMKLSKKLDLPKKLKDMNTQKILNEVDRELWPKGE